MATKSQANSRRMYSWWWDSHISPKNSKWLQENLTDMDAKVKQMIKLIEEDADSFARRAEMYYKKRPELMKMVEEFYRAYRALAERYDHATGVIRHAHKTMAEAFPNQVPMMLTDDLPAISPTETEPHTPEMRHPSRAFLDPDEPQKDASAHFHAIKRNGGYTGEPDSPLNKTVKWKYWGMWNLDEILNLRETIEKVEQEVELRIDERNALQQEIYCLKEELNDVNKKHEAMIEEVRSTDLDPQCFGSSVKKLQDENLKLKETCEADKGEKEALLSKQFLALQIEVQKILQKNQELELTISKGEERMEVMTIETDNLRKQLSDLEKSHNNLQEDSCKILEEKKSLTRRFLDLGEEKSNLEEEICVMIHEAIAQSNLSLIYENIIFEKLMELKELGEDLDKHCSANNDLDERLRVMMCKLENAEMENSHLKESFVKSNVELHLVESINGQLSCQIRDEREMLHLKENELLEAAEMFHVLHTEKTELQRMVEDLKIKYDEARVMLEEQANQILKLSSDKDHQNEELLCLSEVNQKLESEMGYLRQELGETKLREKKLGDEVLKGTNEIEQWETQASTLFAELQISAVNETLFEGKVCELNEMFRVLHTEKTELQRMVEDLKTKYDEARVMLEEKASRILKLSSDKDRQNEELICLCEVNQKLESEIGYLRRELGDTKLREKKLGDEVLKGTNEIEQWETQASTLFAELQIFAVNETLFEGKVCELADACENLERRNYSKDMESEHLKERVSELEVENGRLCEQLIAYVPAVSALNDCITSLEMQTLAHEKPHDHEESKVNSLVNNECTENGQQTDEDRTVVAPDALPYFQDMQRRINAIAMAVKQLNESFKSKHVENMQASKHVTQADQARPDTPVTEIEVLPKDIMLDQISECSSYGISRRREILEADDQMLELWETADKDAAIGKQAEKTQKMVAEAAGNHQRGATMELRNKYPSTDSLVEKELSVDKLEVSRRLTLPREEGNQSKILERLDSDAQKLTNLQITVQDLMKKVEINERSTKGKGVEFDEVKGQLEAAQENITKLFDTNRKLMMNMEEGTLSSVGKDAAESGESGSVSRRRVSEQARRESEKIGQLHLEVQRLQFLLLKLGDGKEIKEKTKMTDRSPRVLLRDYIYGGMRTNNQKKKKKLPFCACVRPPTKGD
ncbi:hypothetical protein JHK85_004308 [Glycine max]|nr:hypothetical protein JHK85_004308 [Glycine max]